MDYFIPKETLRIFHLKFKIFLQIKKKRKANIIHIKIESSRQLIKISIKSL